MQELNKSERKPDPQTISALSLGEPAPKAGRGLRTAEWVSNSTNVAPPSPWYSHRLYVAALLSGGSWIGLQVMNALVGRKLATKAVIPEKDVFALLRPLYKKLDYNPHSTKSRDEWIGISHALIPGIIGGIGAYIGSEIYFHDRNKKAKTAKYLEDIGDKISLKRSEPWAVMSAFGALPGAKFGGVFLPVPGLNYPFTLGNRFSMGSGREVIMPGFGNFWTENTSKLPFGQKQLLEHIFLYLTHNKAEIPDRLPEYSRHLLRGWFPHASNQQIADFCNALMEVRSLYYKPGGVPEDKKLDLLDEFKKHFTKQELENWLNAHEMPVHMAHIKRGMAARISDNLGVGKEVEQIDKNFRQKVLERRNQQQQKQLEPAL